MRRLVVSACLLAAVAFGQYKLDSTGAPPSELAAGIRGALQQEGAKIIGPDGSPYAEIWLRAQAPGGSNPEQNVSFTDVAHGALMGVVRFPGKATDRRGQAIAPGVYTLRLSFFPVDGAHQGVSQTRDFLLLVSADLDKDPNATPGYKDLIELSKKASGTNHPAILNAWKGESGGQTELKQEGEDWVLHSKLGNEPIAIIVVGTFTG
jgi:hypothetical protein